MIADQLSPFQPTQLIGCSSFEIESPRGSGDESRVDHPGGDEVADGVVDGPDGPVDQ